MLCQKVERCRSCLSQKVPWYFQSNCRFYVEDEDHDEDEDEDEDDDDEDDDGDVFLEEARSTYMFTFHV